MPSKTSENSLESMLDSLSVFCSPEDDSSGLVDIITFCEDPRYLNFLGQDPAMTLWPMQKIVLKMFYRGTRGNQHIKLDDNEVEMLRKINEEEELDYDSDSNGFIQVYEKYLRNVEFTHLLLVMGRRSSKTTMVSIIAAYEAYKLCECPEGNPQKYYRVAPDKEIFIINVATNEKQALILFSEIESRIARGPYFRDKISQDHWKKGEIKLLTSADKRENEERKKNGVAGKVEGSIVLMSGHSNSASLRGNAAICVLFDEFAHFKTTTGVSSGDEVYNAIMPSMKQFGKDGKVIILSDPRGKDGMFWRLFQMAQKKTEENGTVLYPYDDILALQLPTWRMNPEPSFDKKSLELKEMAKDPVAYVTTWGARFVGSEGSKMFDEAKLEMCFDHSLREPEFGKHNTLYHLHLDPATTSHNYALALVHMNVDINQFGGKDRHMIVDFVKHWHPSADGPVNIADVEREILRICGRFKVATVTFDSWQSAQTIQNLKARRVKAFETPYRDNYITTIYGELRNLVHHNQVSIYPDPLLMGEMKSLLYKVNARGMTKMTDKKGEFKTDDVVDAVAGAAFQAIHYITARGWPKSRTVNTFGR